MAGILEPKGLSKSERIEKLTAKVLELEGKVEHRVAALDFYADPQTYWNCSFSAEPPFGKFVSDIEIVGGNNYRGFSLNGHPGKLARETIKALGEKIDHEEKEA